MQQGKRTRARDTRGRAVPGIYVRDGVYSAGYRHDGKWRIVNLSARTLTEARRERESLLAGLREGRTATSTALTFESLFNDHQESRPLAQRTQDHERYLLDIHLAALKHRRVQDVTTTELARRLRELRSTHAEWTCVGVYRILAGTFAHGVRRGVLTHSPIDGLAPAERPKQRNKKPVARLEPAAIQKLVSAASTSRWQAALGLAGYAGLRLGEIRGLRWGDVDLEAGVLHVRHALKRDGTLGRPKTDAGLRDVPLLPDLRRVLVASKLKAPLSRDSDYVIATADGKPVMERNLNRALKAAKVAAGLDQGDGRLSMHSLRHSFASMLATDLELPATTLAAITGHTDPGFTLRVYARDTRSTEAVVADVLARASAAGIAS